MNHPDSSVPPGRTTNGAPRRARAPRDETPPSAAPNGLPRAGSSLDEMHVWTERYDRKFAQAALERVQAIADVVTRFEINEAIVGRDL